MTQKGLLHSSASTEDSRPLGQGGSREGEEGDKPAATIRRTPEDFVVEELPAYAPSGRGEHLFITFKKRELTTLEAVRRLAAALDVDARSAGFAGMKDRHAVTTQTASFAFPIAREAPSAVAHLAVPGVEILSAARHDHKLKPGHLKGNCFTIVLSDVPRRSLDRARARLESAGRLGVPNAFGPQRFGRDGDNPARALAWLAGRERGPRDRREQRLLFSAVQSLLFNQVLERRVESDTWMTVLPGDVAKKHDSSGLFTVPLSGAELADAKARAEAGLLSATGPMFGAKMRWPEGEPLAIEREILAASAFSEPGALAAHHKLGEGSRRPLRLSVDALSISVEDPEASTDPTSGEERLLRVAVRFVLPKGGYATTVLGRAFRLIDAAASRSPELGAGRADLELTDRPDRAGREDGSARPDELCEDLPSLPLHEEDSV